MEFRADPKQARLLPLQVRAPDIEEWLLARDPQAIGSWKDMGREEYARAFTAAQTAGYDVVDDLYFGLVDNVARGGTEADFSKLVVPILKSKGWLGGDEGQIANRVRLIYDTNLRLARAAGRWAHYQAGKQAAPYLRAFTVRDERVRHPPKSPHADHRAWDGIVLPVDHDFWRVYWPPLGFRCRCSVVQMTRSQLARWRGGITSDDELEDRIKRLGPPVFMSPAMPFSAHLVAMVEETNNPTPRPSKGWTVDGVSGLSAEQANARMAADQPRMPGLPRVNPVETARKGGDAFDAVLRAKSLNDIGRQLAAMGF